MSLVLRVCVLDHLRVTASVVEVVPVGKFARLPLRADTVGKVSTVRQYKKFSSTDGEFFWTVGIQALKCVSTAGTGNDPIVTEILY
jgi:hypothetical protein